MDKVGIILNFWICVLGFELVDVYMFIFLI